MGDTQTTVALSVLGAIILLLALLLIALCVLRRRVHDKPSVEYIQEGELTAHMEPHHGGTPSMISEKVRSAQIAIEPVRIVRNNVLYDDIHIDPSLKITYVSDVEGNWEFFCAYVARAEGLRWRRGGPSVDGLEIVDGWRFIFGGDSVDKGGSVGGSVRFVLCLVSLKKRYPGRVTILLGNRDLNKLRLTSELDVAQLSESLLEALPGPKWLPAGPKRVTPAQHLRKLLSGRLGVDPADVPAASLAEANTLANRLRYILKETMGADGELERRIEELRVMEEEGADLSLVLGSAEQVAAVPSSGEGHDVDRAVASFVASVAPGGWMRLLLQMGELGVVMGDTLFVHGGLISRDYLNGEDDESDTDAFGHVPGQPTPFNENVIDWLHRLQAWKRETLQQWMSQPRWSDPSRPGGADGNLRGGEGLLDYVLPGTGPSVVMGRHLDEQSMPRAAPYSLMVKCNRSAIRRLVVGHTPHGNCPTVIKTEEDGHSLEVVMMDTSYSDMKAADNRGQAVSELVLFPSCNVRVHGVLDDGMPYEYTLGVDNGDDVELVGRLELSTLAARKPSGEPMPRFVKAKMEKGDYLLCHVARFKFDYYYVPEEETARNVGAAAALDDARAFAAGAGLMRPGSVRRGALTGSMRNGARSWSIKERAATIVAT